MSQSFFQEFLVISDAWTAVFLLAIIALFGFVWWLGKTGLSFSSRLLISTGLGILLGVAVLWTGGFPYEPSEITWMNEVNHWYHLFANGFMRLLQMIVIPLVFVSIIRVFTNMSKEAGVGKLVGRTVGTLLMFVTLGLVIGSLVAWGFGLGTSANVLESGEALRETSSIVNTVLNLIPSNPVQSMANNAVIPTIIFAVFIGTATNWQSKKSAQSVIPFVNLVESCYQIITNVANMVIKLMPYAVIALLANVLVGRGLSVLSDALGFAGAYYLSVVILFMVHMLFLWFRGLNPIQYMKNVMDALILAFTSRSSLATLPVSIEKLTKNAGVNQGTSTFVASLGANGGMTGAGIYAGIFAVMLANLAGVPVDFGFILMLVIVMALSTFGIAGVPGGILLIISIVISAVGLGEHFHLMGAVIAIDALMDMGRTFINVNGALVTSVSVGKSLNQVNIEVYNQQVPSQTWKPNNPVSSS